MRRGFVRADGNGFFDMPEQLPGRSSVPWGRGQR